ncbi:hypothetical protein [Saccharopolyspora pogona]|uniref:hypothetical protein n=1 Tax=Saccharopolyspora pogona TaxID=333966 RepID=UPI001687986B|nr:hypothetical protein [Saccharopolyspora pogona]
MDPLLLRLHKRLGLGTSTDSDIRLSTTVDGYLADALFRDDSALTAVLIDRGPGSNQVPPARHLRLQFERLGLLSGEDGARRCVRVPAWQLYCDQTSLLEHHKTPTA